MTSTLLQRRHLEVLIAVADSGSVHGAARGLGLTQPALSRLLAESERLLGGALLFERSSQGSVVTRQGQTLLAQARFVLRGFERLGDIDGLARPPIRLGCIARAMHTLIPSILERIYPADDITRRANGALRFHLTEGSSTALLDAVAKGDLDFAILRDVRDAALAAEVVAERLYDDRIVVICSAAAKTVWREPVSLAVLAEHDWILPEPQTGSRVEFDRFWSGHRLPLIRPLVEARSFETSLALVARTRFLSIAPESIARRHATRGEVRIVRSRLPLPASPVTLVFNPLASEDAVLKRFRSIIHASVPKGRSFQPKSR